MKIAILVVLIDIAVSLRRLLKGGTHYGTRYSWLYPLDWPMLIYQWVKSE